MLGQVHTILYVKNVDRCVAFYRDVLGMPVQSANADRALLKINGASLLLLKRDEQGSLDVGPIRLALDVDDLDMAYRELSAKSVIFSNPPADTVIGRQATLCDPDGTPIDLIQWADPASGNVSSKTVVNDILTRSPEAMEVLEEHGIRICGGCIVLLNGTVQETAEYSGLSRSESAEMVRELNAKLTGSAQ